MQSLEFVIYVFKWEILFASYSSGDLAQVIIKVIQLLINTRLL